MKLQFIDKSPQVDDIWTFRFSPPDETVWLPGQSVRLELPVGYGSEEKRFTICSAPYEGRFDITTRLSGSKFKNSLDSLAPNQAIDAYAIEGDFVFTDGKPKLLVASGIGITPFVSILRQLVHDNKSSDLTLVYADRCAELLYEKELQTLSQALSFDLQLIRGRRLSLADLDPTGGEQVYISGPEAMVKQLQTELIASGYPVSDIKTDLFTGRLDY